MAYIGAMKWIIGLALLAIIGALASAGRAMLKDGRDGAPKTNRMVHALAFRVAVSVALFVFILVAYLLGWIEPTGLPVGR
jgi:hypothetical protein